MTTNGKTPAADKTGGIQVPTPEQVAQADAMLNRVTPQLRAVVGTMIRGLMMSFPGVAPHAILTMICFETANFAGQALQGDIAMMSGIRKGYRDAFEEGLRKAPIVAASKPGEMPTNLRG